MQNPKRFLGVAKWTYFTS